ncbi:MAG: coproporphyrinogen dehydrogenase HemZ [Desulfitobacterium hafniense]|nr:coproporphyrinogen dehydrogenase HemZ [Desulfitobacterium hafniense]
MRILLTSNSISGQVLESGLSLIRAFFPEAQVSVGFPSEGIPDISSDINPDIAMIKVDRESGNFVAYWHGSLKKKNEHTERTDHPDRTEELSGAEEASILGVPDIGKEDITKILLKHIVLKLLTKITGITLPWGILTGIRPTKLIHKMNDLAIDKSIREAVLKNKYAVSNSKIKLLEEIADIQKPYLDKLKLKPNLVSVYVGIPFCPSRCSYCSFPGFPATGSRDGLKKYLESLSQEIHLVSDDLTALGLRANNIYIGGGTPTVLTPPELGKLLDELENLPRSKEIEVTVEAGRPDTITIEKLTLFKARGVNRLSINPQTMQDRTLKRIGRNHTAQEIIDIYNLAKNMSDWIVNMDLILGLPGEDVKDVEDSLNQVRHLNPDNLTIHVLALKRGSKEKESGYKHTDTWEIKRMQETTSSLTKEWGLKPYYLYRQKEMAGNLENIGYAYVGTECHYNISIMEERQSIVGIGAGASTKIVNLKDFSLKNIQHSYNWDAYCTNWRDLHEERVNLLQKNFGLNINFS